MKQLGAAVLSLFWPVLAFAAEEAEEQMAKAEVWQVVLFLGLFLAFCVGTVWLMYRAKKTNPDDSKG